jgi:hypothetical protein
MDIATSLMSSTHQKIGQTELGTKISKKKTKIEDQKADF